MEHKNLQPKQMSELRFWENIKVHGCRGFSPEEWKIAVQYFRQYSLMYINRDLNNLKYKIAIEVGCGPDSVLSNLENVVAIGIDPLINEYHKLWDLSKDGVTYICSEIETLNLNIMADIVICWNVLDHVSDIDLAAKKLSEILHPDGELWFMVNLDDTKNSTEVVKENPDGMHPFKVNIDSISKLLIKYGFFWKEKVLITFQMGNRYPILMGVLGKVDTAGET